MDGNRIASQKLNILDDNLYKSQRIVDDFYARTRPGPIFYIVAIWLSALNDDMLNLYLPEVIYSSLFFLFLAIVRLSLRKPENNITAISNWQRINWLLIYCSAIGWGIYFGWVLSIQSLNHSMLVLMLATISFATIYCYWFCMHLLLCQFASILFVLPAIAVIVLFQPDDFPLAIGLAVFSAFIIITAIRNNRHYYQQIDHEVSLHKVQLELKKLSSTDDLTGLANRREYNSFMEQAFNRARRNSAKLSLVILDLDNFKTVNDNYGHAVGDQCLQHVAKILTSHGKRDTDLKARIGGEEFALILPDTEMLSALNLASILCDTMNQSTFAAANSNLTITASFGVGEYNNAGDKTPDDFFNRVDAAVYAAKRNGKNRVEIAHPTIITTQLHNCIAPENNTKSLES